MFGSVSLPLEHTARAQEHVVCHVIHGDMSADLVEVVDVGHIHLSLAAIDGASVSLFVLVPVEVVEDVQKFSCFHLDQTWAYAVEYRLHSYAMRIGTESQSRVRSASHADIPFYAVAIEFLELSHGLLQFRELSSQVDTPRLEDIQDLFARCFDDVTARSEAIDLRDSFAGGQ